MLYIDLRPCQTCHSKDGRSAYSIDVGELGWQYGTGLKSHGTVTNWCTGREWPVNCMTVISVRWRSHMPFQRRRKWHILMASYRKRSRWRAWLTIWDKVKIPPCRHKEMHRKRVTCELHDSYFRLMTITHAISKTAEVTHSDCQLWEEIAGVWSCVHISAGEFDGNIKPTNWTEDSEKFRCSRKLVPSLHRVRFLGHRLLTLRSPDLIDERF